MSNSKFFALWALNTVVNLLYSSRDGDIHLIFVDKDAWGPGTGIDFRRQLAEFTMEMCHPSYSSTRGRMNMYRSPTSRLPVGFPQPLHAVKKMVLVAVSINQTELLMARNNGFVDTVIIKPLRASMVEACLKQVLGVGNGRERGHELRGGVISLRNLLSGKRFLVVDDNIVNRKVAAGALNKYGAQVECVSSGKEAIQKLKHPHNFDACFMDVQMPEMDGYDISTQLILLTSLSTVSLECLKL